MDIVAHPLEDPWSLLPPVFAHLSRGGPGATAFFTYDPTSPDSFARRAAWIDARGPRAYPRAVVAEVLVRLGQRLEAHPAALEAAKTLADPAALAVVTGQQAGLLGGPLFTLFKAITALRLSRQLSAQLGRPVVAVFWLATEDHDWEEASRIAVVDRRGELRELRLTARGSPRRPIGQIPVPAQAESVLAELAQALGCPPEAVEELARLAKASSSLGEWCARILVRWLSPLGLVLLDPMEPALREAARPVFSAALVHREAIHRELEAAAQRLHHRGAEPLLRYGPEHTHLFYLHQGERLALFWRDGALADRSGRVRLTLAEAVRAIQQEPQRFSPDVVLRPIVQDHLLPTVALVAGPSEAQYLAQLREVYRLFGLEMPVCVARHSLTLVPPQVAEALRHFGLSAGQVMTDPQQAIRQALARLDSVDIEGTLEALRAAVEQAYDAASSRLQALPSLGPLLAENRARVLYQIEYLRRKAWQHHRRRHRQELRRLEEAVRWLRPLGQLQERVLGAVQFVLWGGEPFLRALLRLPLEPGHRIALLGEPAPDCRPEPTLATCRGG